MTHRAGVVAFCLAAAAQLTLARQPAAAGQVQIPAQCEAYLTVQSRGCQVSHYYRCAGDPAGHQWRVDVGAEGPFFRSQIDSEGQWLFSEDLIGGYVLKLTEKNPDPASLTTLYAKGYDSYDFSRSLQGATTLRVQGFDRLTGKQTVIDEIALDETEFEYRETGPDGAVITAMKGREYAHREWRLFFSGVYDTEDGPQNRSPARFDMPGDRGFLTDRPEYDCTDQMADATSHFAQTAGLIAPVRLSLASGTAQAVAHPKE